MKLYESMSRTLKEADDFKNKVDAIFGRDLPLGEDFGYAIDDNIVIDRGTDENGNYVDNAVTFGVQGNYLIPDIEGGELDTQAPDFVRDKSGTQYGDMIVFKDVDDTKIKELYNKVKSSMKPIKTAQETGTNWAEIIEDSDMVEESDENSLSQELTTFINSVINVQDTQVLRAEVTEDHIGVYVSVNNNILYQEVINLDKVKSFIDSKM